MTTPTLVVFRGLPACGKTTEARARVAASPGTRARVNRDDIRDMLHNSVFEGEVTEDQVVAVRDAAILSLLRAGRTVFCDDTNLPLAAVKALYRLARRAGALFEVHDMTNVSLSLCLERNALRTGRAYVPPAKIRRMWREDINGKGFPLPLPDVSDEPYVEPYVEPDDRDLPVAVLVDIDGVMALRGDRSPYDETRVLEDAVNDPVRMVVLALAAASKRIIFMSGRSEKCRDDTVKWLARHYPFRYEALYMRPAGDTRTDWIVKLELFNRHVRGRYRVRCVVDDRDQVVNMYRLMGLTVLQVAPGDF